MSGKVPYQFQEQPASGSSPGTEQHGRCLLQSPWSSSAGNRNMIGDEAQWSSWHRSSWQWGGLPTD